MTPEQAESLRKAQANHTTRTGLTQTPDSGRLPGRIEFPLPPADPERDQQLAAEREARIATEASRRRGEAWQSLLSRIGRRYEHVTLDSFEIYDEKQRPVLERVREYEARMDAKIAMGRPLVLFGPPGSGKDHLMACLMRRAIELDFIVEWKNGMDLYGDVRDSIDSAETRESKMIRDFTAPHVLAISDPLPPKGDISQFQGTTMFRILDGRYRMMKPTWLTMNVKNFQEASERLGASLADRLCDGSTALWCDWASYRRR